MGEKNPKIATATGYRADAATEWTPNTCCADNVPMAQADLSTPYDTQAVDKAPGFKGWTITALAQEWLADPATNFGVLLNPDRSKPRDRYRYFAGAEHPDPNLRPYLELTYIPPPTGSTLPVPDLIGPTVSVTAPAAGATVSGTVNVSADAADILGVAGVQFELDGVNLGAEDTSPPYSVSWSTSTSTNGSHALRAVARNILGIIGRSAAVSVTVAANDSTPPVLSAVTASAITSSGATISCTTDEPGDSQADYGTTTAYGSSSGLDGSRVTAHTVTLSGLAAGTTYHYRVRSKDAAGNPGVSGDFTFTTVAAADVTPPAVSLTSPAAGATVSGTIAVSATASDNVGVAGVQFRLDGAVLGPEDTASPYSISWNTTTASDGSHTLTAIARDAVGNQTTSAGAIVSVSNGAPPPGGIAALYPGDAGIENHPDVIFAERFEQPTLAELFARWTDVLNGNAMSLTSDVPPGSPGSRSLNIPWAGGGVNNGGHLYRHLSPGIDDTLYVRYYIKYPASGKFHHTGIWIGGNNPSLAWPNPQAGIKPVGDDRFIAGAEQNSLTTGFDHYNYWMNMRPDGSGTHWGNFLLNNPSVDAGAGDWTCVEHMVKLNNPVTAFNGEHAIWLDGVKVSHLGQGFPNGSWSGGIFTQNPSDTPFEGFRWRSSTSLNLNWIWLQNYSPDDPAGFTGDMSFDHVVVATSYIGCLAPGSGSPDTTPPTISMSAPAAGSTITGAAVTVSATAADDVGVTGVQFKLDGADLGGQDTTTPFSVSWNTTTAANGAHALSAVTRDAAGNTTVSETVTVTVPHSVP